LWPSLRAAGVPDPESWLIWYDTSELTQPPDRAAEAQALHQVGALSAEALLRENGFSLKDRPTDEERRNELARQLVLAKPELLPVLAKYVGFESEQEEIRQAVQSMRPTQPGPDRKSTRLNSSHVKISYAVFCLKTTKGQSASQR